MPEPARLSPADLHDPLGQHRLQVEECDSHQALVVLDRGAVAIEHARQGADAMHPGVGHCELADGSRLLGRRGVTDDLQVADRVPSVGGAEPSRRLQRHGCARRSALEDDFVELLLELCCLCGDRRAEP